MDAPAEIVTMSSMVPVPEGVKPVAPAVAVAVHEAELKVRTTPSGLKISAPVTVLGPVFETTIVYVTVEPRTAEPTAPLIDDPPSLSVKVTETFP